MTIVIEGCRLPCSLAMTALTVSSESNRLMVRVSCIIIIICMTAVAFIRCCIIVAVVAAAAVGNIRVSSQKFIKIVMDRERMQAASQDLWYGRSRSL